MLEPMNPDNDRAALSGELIRLYRQGDLGGAEALARRMTEDWPDEGFGWKALGTVLCLRRRPAEALPALEEAVRLLPGNAEAWNALGNACRSLHRFEAANEHYRRALAFDPRYAEAWNNLGNLLHRNLKRNAECLEVCRQGLAACPDHAGLANLLGGVHLQVGRAGQAVAAFRRALELNPDYLSAYSNLLLACQYDPDIDVAGTVALARGYGARVAQRAKRHSGWANPRDPERRLRVGLVSGDFGNHPVGNFLHGVLGRVDPGEIELFAYSNRKTPDAITERIRSQVSHWRDIWGMDDEPAAQLVREDGIDILVDLAGHTGETRLPLFAWKAAPVQVAWLGYFATTGVEAIDYILADRWVLPPEEEGHFVEKPWRLPDAYYCCTPPEHTSPVGPLPALRNGHVTFGCFNNLAKIPDSVVACWSRILQAVPGSRLFLKASPFAEPEVRELFEQRFAAHGIAPERLILETSSGRYAYFRSYRRVDLALDPFPFPGGATTVEGLWMGVPVVTLKGRCFIGHQGETLLQNTGLAEWIAGDVDEYVAKAVAFAADLPRLAALRAGLREQVHHSPLFDTGRFAGNLQAAFRGMWRTWCAGNEQ